MERTLKISTVIFHALFVLLVVSCESKNSEITKAVSYRDTLPKATGYVNDFEKIFEEPEKQILDSLLTSFESKTSIQIVLVTLDMTTVPANIETVALEILRSWGVGQKEKNNGVVILISRTDRKMRIENGHGIEAILSDDETKEIIDNYFIPYYRESKYFVGTMTGLKEFMRILESRNKVDK